MGIRKLADNVEVRVGHWVCKESAFADGICGAPKLVDAVSNSRVYVIGEDDRTTYMNRGSIVFVCDTKAEADSMYALSKQQESDLRSSKIAILESYMARINQMTGG